MATSLARTRRLAMIAASSFTVMSCVGREFTVRHSDADASTEVGTGGTTNREYAGGSAGVAFTSSGGNGTNGDLGDISNAGSAGQSKGANGGGPQGGTSSDGAGGAVTNGAGGKVTSETGGSVTSADGGAPPSADAGAAMCVPDATCLACCARLFPSKDTVFAARLYGCACITACVGICRCNADYGSPSLDCVACMSEHIDETACKDDWNACQVDPQCTEFGKCAFGCL